MRTVWMVCVLASVACRNDWSPGADNGGEDMTAASLPQLLVNPANATITIIDKTAKVSQAFVATLDGAPVGATWSLDTYEVGDISGQGVFTTKGMAGGMVTVRATSSGLTAIATLTVKVALLETVVQNMSDPGPSAANKTALSGPPLPDPGASAMPANPSKILYPYNETVMPRGLTSPLLQFSPGNLPPEDALVTLSSANFSWQGFFHVLASATPRFDIPQDVWNAALQTSGGQTLTISVVKAVAGKAYGPALTSVIVANTSLKGAVYYMTYQSPTGVYSVKPGVREPAKLVLNGCNVCHSVSSNGTRLAVGAHDAASAPYTGIYKVGSDGTATQLTGAPPGLTGDTRGISFANFTPDGAYVMRSKNNFWGGVNQLAWKIDEVAKTLTPATVNGLGVTVSALIPTISHDGKLYAFTNGPGQAAAVGTAHRSISLMDLSVDALTNTLTFSNRRLVVDNGASGAVTKFATFLPDPNFLVLQEGEGYYSGFDEMLPTWGPNTSYTTSTGRLHMVNISTKEHLELRRLNEGNATINRQRNYEPFTLPVAAGGYFWVVFTSIRDYGNTYAGAGVRKQLWVAAISTNPVAGQDPSHPPFFLPNQTSTTNERGFWAMEPCRPGGNLCETGDECCDGYCRPTDAIDPQSPRVCVPPQTGCSQIAEKCTTNTDCCDYATGVDCIGGYCSIRIN